MGRGPKPAKSKIGAKRPISHKSSENDARIQDLEERLAESLEREAEALERETAASEILRIISSSPADVQPVLDAVAASAARLCEAVDANIFRREADRLLLVAHHGGPIPHGGAVGEFALPLTPGTPPGRAVIDGRTVHVADVQADTDEFPQGRELGRRLGFHTVLGVPLMREDVAIGVIAIRRIEVRLFAERQVALLKTFADQAVIAIENVRLFNETKEALEQQTATSEILRVISSSPTDVQPVFTAMAASAARLCEARDTTIFRVDGDVLRLVAHEGPIAPDAVLPLTDGTVGGRVIRERRAIHVADMQAVETHDYPISSEFARSRGFRTILSVPLLHGGQAIGLIAIRRAEVRPFTDRQLELVKTFAEQAVIAIENVRLFKELEVRNIDLADALERQTATSEILRAISSSPTDTQPVFDTIAANAARLCAARDAQVLTVQGDVLILVSAYGSASMPPVRSLSRGHAVGRAVIDRQTIHVRDQAQAVAEFPETSAPQHGVQSHVAVPLLREDVAVGVIRVSRTQVQPFTDQQIALLQTFADQAVIAIENVRLFTELQENNRALTEAFDRQTATSEILRVISRSPTDVQPVFDAIIRSAVQLCEGVFGALLRVDGDALHMVADHNFTPEARRVYRQVFPMALTHDSRRNVSARAVIDRTVVNLADIRQEPDFGISGRLSEDLKFRAILSVPMVRDGSVIGAITVARAGAGSFAENQVELLRTFADQAAIAIENVRLFKELEAANRELAAASQHKSEFLANMSHELRTPLNAIIGFSEVLSEKMFGELNEKQEEYSKDIHASGQHLLSLINDILDLSKIEAGRMELELSDFHLPTALDSALTLVRERAGRRSIRLHTAIDPQLGQIQADERKVRQVVLNLLSNAIKFTPEGGRIEVAGVAKDGLVEVSVTDSGVGIAPEDQEAVFEEFRQVGTADKKVEGTGLGLTLCRKFVQLHGGRIWVKSQTGAGSTFTFTIPIGK